MWVYGAPVSISGADIIDIPMGAVLVVLDSIPAGLGLVAGEPDRYYDLGYVAWLVGDHALPATVLHFADTLLDDPPRGVTGIAYSLRPFVSGTLAPAWWESGTAIGEGRLAPAGADPAAPGWIVLG